LRRYRTLIVIPADRTVVLQLPEHLAEGPATLIVEVAEPEDGEEFDALHAVEALDNEDIEWWEEFEDGEGAGPDEEPSPAEGPRGRED
jgi:hypothetical protein